MVHHQMVINSLLLGDQIITLIIMVIFEIAEVIVRSSIDPQKIIKFKTICQINGILPQPLIVMVMGCWMLKTLSLKLLI